SHDTADGGSGTDTVRLELTQEQFDSAAVQADLAAYQTFLTAHANPNTDNGATFHFTAFDLSVTDFEQVNVVIVNGLVVNPLTTSIIDTSLTDAGNIVALGNLITDAGDSVGDLSTVLSVSDVNGTPVSGILDVAGQYGTLTVFSDGTYFY